MQTRIIIQQARSDDLATIKHQQSNSSARLAATSEARAEFREWLEIEHRERLPERLADQCLLVARAGRRIVGSGGLDLADCTLAGLSVLPDWRGQGIGRRLVAELERQAIEFGIDRLSCTVPPAALGFFQACRYQERPGAVSAAARGAGLETLSMHRHFPRRQTRYGRRVKALLVELGIPRDYGRRHRLRLTGESTELANIGLDPAGREQYLFPAAAMAWYAMRNAAAADGVELQVISAFRSVSYQAGIIRNKLAGGQSLERILGVSAAPGFSEHHSGRALDLGCPGSEPLELQFELTRAFEWLVHNAPDHGFRMSYPRNNRHMIAFEPWHWAWTG
jgi:D-alanyl-D-alanine carboxypeptidase